MFLVAKKIYFLCILYSLYKIDEVTPNYYRKSVNILYPQRRSKILTKSIKIDFSGLEQ